MNPFISLCMIVKNEEKVLKRCLESVKDYVDEIIIADTGSTDNTLSIASLYTQNIYHFKWINDFSAARNFVQSKAAGEWILYLDADEYVEVDNLRKILQQLKISKELKKFDAFVVTQVNFVGALGGNVGQCPTVRIYKNDPNILFHRKIHEQLYKKDGQLSIGILGLNVYHSGYLFSTAQEKNKNLRNVSLIKREISKNKRSGFDYYNLANEYLSQWKVEDALSSYQKAFQFKGSIDKLWVPMAVERIVFCLIELKRYNEALKVANEAISQWPNFADFSSQKALIFFKQNRFEDAKQQLLPLIQNREMYTTVNSLSYLDYMPYYILGQVSEYNKDFSKAILYYVQALNFNDKDIDTLKRFYLLLLKNETKENIINFISNRVSMNNDINRIFFLKILLDNGEFTLVEYFLKEWHISISTAFDFKLNIVKGRYNFTRLLLKRNSIDDLLSEGWVDSYDFILLALQLEKIEVLQQLLESDSGSDYTSLISLYKNVPITEVEKFKSHIMLLLDRCIKLGKYELIDKIVSYISELGMYTEVGNLFFKYGFEEIAIDFYSEVQNYNELNDQAFLNIIEWFIKNQNEDEALKWSLQALENNKIDFRIYKLTIQLLDSRKAYDDMKKIIEFAKVIYPNSTYLNAYTEKVLGK